MTEADRKESPEKNPLRTLVDSFRVPSSWAKDLHGRRVDFKSEEGLAWGIELVLPIEELLKSQLRTSLGLVIPETITDIRY